MKRDVIDALSGKFPRRIPSKETLNHPGIIRHVSGLDVFENTHSAFDIAWRKLGIDIHAPRPRQNALRPQVPGGTWQQDRFCFSDIGVFPTSTPLEYVPGLAKDNWDWVFGYDAAQDGFLPPERTLPEAELQASYREHGGLQGEGRLGNEAMLRQLSRDFQAHYGSEAVMYHLYYTTLFMWPVVTFGWEAFMMAAMMDPERFDAQLWQPWAEVSRRHFEVMAQTDAEVVFCHDDLAMKSGPVFPLEFYEQYIFPRYPAILEPAVKAGKKIVFVCDGNMDAFLERLLELPIDGLMFENPATPFERVLDTWGKAGRGFIGGIATEILTNHPPEEVRAHTLEVIEKGRRYPGFMISSCGGLHGNIPIDNMLAYFAARHEAGISADLP